jgi:alpha/beta superfamily hydrolase
MTFPSTETALIIPGPAGELEAVFSPALVSTSSNKIAIMCHPHPLYDGTMNNKVVTTSCKAFQECGISTIRFNYRGVGKSTGSFGNFIGETADLLAIIDWVKSNVENPRLWLAGFSFGSYIAAQGALQCSSLVEQLITIAPAVNHADFQIFANIKCPWLVIASMEDEIVPLQDVRSWLAQLPLNLNIKVVEVPEASHFFHGKLIELRDIIIQNTCANFRGE